MNPETSKSAGGSPLDMRPAASRPRSESIESLRPTGSGNQPVGTAGGIYRAAPGAKAVIGRAPRAPDPRKYKYDVLEGRGTRIGYSVSRDDRMSAVEAGAALDGIHKMCGVDREEPHILYAFDQALWFFHTVNGASVLNPGRAKFSLDGYAAEFDYFEIRNKLNVDQRRFFRSFADDIRAANQQVLDSYDPADIKSVEHYGWIVEVAAERGLSRYPYLAHDSADACTELNMNERQALINSKAMVLSATVNSADRARATSRVVGPDGFDSTTGTKI